MKKIVILFLGLLSFVSLSAQKDLDDVTEVFVFNEFMDGVAHFKDGTKGKSKMNYGTYTEKFYFLEDRTVMELANTDEISSVTLGQYVFEPVKSGMFYEKVEAGKGNLYIRWKTRINSIGKVGAYGIENRSGGVLSINRLRNPSRTDGLKINERVAELNQNMYYLKIKGKFKKISSFKDLAKMFGDHKDDIISYVEGNKLEFRNVDDVLKATTYAFGL